MWVDRCVESTGGEQTRGRCALHCLGRVRGDEGGWAWCSLWVVMLMRMQDALGKSSPGSGPCILEGLTFPVTTFTKGQGILVPLPFFAILQVLGNLQFSAQMSPSLLIVSA